MITFFIFIFICVFQDCHLFKWVEDRTYEEVSELKAEGTFLINYLKLQIENLKEEIQRCKNEMKKFKRKTIVLFDGLCVVAIVVVAIVVDRCDFRRDKRANLVT